MDGLELAAPSAHSRRGAVFDAKQFGLEQRFDNRRAVHPRKPAAPSAQIVDLPRHQLFASAGLSFVATLVEGSVSWSICPPTIWGQVGALGRETRAKGLPILVGAVGRGSERLAGSCHTGRRRSGWRGSGTVTSSRERLLADGVSIVAVDIGECSQTLLRRMKRAGN